MLAKIGNRESRRKAVKGASRGIVPTSAPVAVMLDWSWSLRDAGWRRWGWGVRGGGQGRVNG